MFGFGQGCVQSFPWERLIVLGAHQITWHPGNSLDRCWTPWDVWKPLDTRPLSYCSVEVGHCWVSVQTCICWQTQECCETTKFVPELLCTMEKHELMFHRIWSPCAGVIRYKYCQMVIWSLGTMWKLPVGFISTRDVGAYYLTWLMIPCNCMMIRVQCLETVPVADTQRSCYRKVYVVFQPLHWYRLLK